VSGNDEIPVCVRGYVRGYMCVCGGLGGQCVCVCVRERERLWQVLSRFSLSMRPFVSGNAVLPVCVCVWGGGVCL